MLSLFPELFTYEQIVPFIIRLILTVIFLRNGYFGLFKNGKFWTRLAGAIGIISGGLLLAGFLTQLAAILISAITIINITKIKRETRPPRKRSVAGAEGFWADYEYNLLILVCAIALLFLGPGILSIDIPL